MKKLTKQFGKKSDTKVNKGEGEISDTTNNPSPTNYSWIEIVPVLLVLLGVAVFVGFFPLLDFENITHVARERADISELENNFNNSLTTEP